MNAAARLLIVEDEGVVALDLRAALTALGHHVVGVVGSGKDALRLATAEATRPELVLMDIQLRGEMDGVETAHRLRVELDIPVIYLTAYADADTRGRAYGSEPFGYLLKPYTERDLQIAIELALTRSRLELERQRADSERAARAAAEQQVRERDDFLSVAAHELRTPLTSVQLQIESLSRLLDRNGVTDDPTRKKVAAVARQIDRLDKLIDNLLDVTRIVAGKLQLGLDRGQVDLAAVAREVAARLGDEAERAQCALTLTLGDGVVGDWDVLRLDQIVTNLLANALKYGAGKPVEITVATDGAVARLAVRDQGIGIADADRERVFERFERAASARHYGGLGLGLYITRQLVDAHGGKVWVESGVGGGSCFVVELPVG